MTVPASILAAAIAALAAWPARAVEPADCRKTDYVSATCFSFGPRNRCRSLRPAPCFWVEGRLGFGNGTPAARLWPRGTHRLLGVHGGDGDPQSPTLLPRPVDVLSTPPTAGTRRDLWGRFRVCPLASGRPGWMRPVCIAGATDLTVARR
jgi:hypothetical protein